MEFLDCCGSSYVMLKYFLDLFSLGCERKFFICRTFFFGCLHFVYSRQRLHIAMYHLGEMCVLSFFPSTASSSHFEAETWVCADRHIYSSPLFTEKLFSQRIKQFCMRFVEALFQNWYSIWVEIHFTSGGQIRIHFLFDSSWMDKVVLMLRRKAFEKLSTKILSKFSKWNLTNNIFSACNFDWSSNF